jgi:hypothetical protein
MVEVTTLPDSSTSGSVGDQVLFDSDIYRHIEENVKGHLWKGITTDYTSQLPPIGEEIFHDSGTFTVPAMVNKISVVAVGAGGGGASSWSNGSGTGGALAWASDVPVSPGQSITITIPGSSTTYSGRTDYQTNGGDSIVDGILIAGGGFYGSTTSGDYSILTTTAKSSGGGKGGSSNGSWNGGGGGAGGYTGPGGIGGYGSSTAGAGGGGGGGNGYQSSTYGFGGGGGVGIFGAGPSGDGGTVTHGNTWDSISNNYSAGKGGSGGKDGIGQTNSTHSGRDISWPDDNDYGETTQKHGWGGMYGGGGGGSGSSMNANTTYGFGGAGVVRIIWGNGRSFPNNAAYATPVA